MSNQPRSRLFECHLGKCKGRNKTFKNRSGYTQHKNSAHPLFAQRSIVEVEVVDDDDHDDLPFFGNDMDFDSAENDGMEYDASTAPQTSYTHEHPILNGKSVQTLT